jgi:hypothetical protein
MTRLALILALLVAWGAARLPLELNLQRQSVQAHLHSASLDLDLRDQLGQLGFAAALSGFRSIVADFVFIQAQVAWEQTEWSRLLLLLRQTTALQPHGVMFWDMAAWHMAWNASASVMSDESQSLAVRRRKQREYFSLGRDFLERGIRNNPNEPRLDEAMARLYQQKFEDHAAASRYYDAASHLPGAMSYDRRFAAYELSYCEGHDREAWQRLRALYDEGEKERLPTLIKRLKFLETKLNLPAEQRVPNTDPSNR